VPPTLQVTSVEVTSVTLWEYLVSEQSFRIGMAKLTGCYSEECGDSCSGLRQHRLTTRTAE
jgi:hypothetical protein